MRITAQAKQQTRERIVHAARHLFLGRGFAATTTRDIASAADIATGTLFNYFASKEALAMHLIAEAHGEAVETFERTRRGTETLEEDLFRFVRAGQKAMAPIRSFAREAVETSLSPFARAGVCPEADQFRGDHLDFVAGVLAHHAVIPDPAFIAMHLYWTLYVGALAFWSGDDSPNQEDSLVVVDQSMRMFAAALEGLNLETEEHHGSEHR